MQFVLTLLGKPPYLIYFQNLYEWMIWGFLLFILLAVVLYHAKDAIENLNVNRNFALIIFLALPVFSLFIGLRLPGENMRPLPGLPIEPQAPILMLFAMIPMFYLAGTSGRSLAVLAGLLIGTLNAFWNTHSLMTPVEYGLVGWLLAFLLRQDYRTFYYRIARHPIGGAIILAVLSIPLYVFSAFLSVRGSIPIKIDYAISQTYLVMIARATELILAGCVMQILYLVRIGDWRYPDMLKPAPSETSMQVRFFNHIAPFLLILLVGVMAGDWIIAGRAARNLLEERMESTASIAAKNLPYFMETGQNLLIDLADPALLENEPEDMRDALADKLRVVPFFRQLYLFDANGNAVTGYPVDSFEGLQPAKDEISGIQFARDGVSIQTFIIDPWLDGQTAQISMIAAINDDNGELQGILLGRTDLSTNPYTQPAIQALEEISQSGGVGMILDENNDILYHPISSIVMSQYLGAIPNESGFSESVSMDGTQSYMYYYPVEGRPWKVLLSMPIELSQQIALDIALPLLILLLVFSVAVLLSMQFGLKSVTSSLNLLATEASTIASGDLNYTLRSHNEDEVGRFSQSFERMRIRLKRRLEELNGLLKVSEGVAKHIKTDDSMQKILEIALLQGADAVRILLLNQENSNENNTSVKIFSAGELADEYAILDEQILEMMASEEQMIISNTNRMRRLKLVPMKYKPGAIIALPLRMEDTYYGAMWLGYKSERTFDSEQVKFLSTLSNHASIAAANASLFSKAVVGRQRLEAVLRATPEPVLVISEQKQVILMNPAVLQIEGLVQKAEVERPVDEVIKHPQIRKILLEATSAPFDTTHEVSMPNGRTYDVTLSPVWISEEIPAGLVCLMRDITRYKQQDMMKSDFVATVSHDLRVPLSMMRGYATMLPMVGEVNEQQREYVEKIQSSVERMIKLTHNVLNVQRIESGRALDIKEVNPKQILEMVSQTLKPQAFQKKINLSIELKLLDTASEPRLIEADPDLLQQALYNLVENAIKFCSVKGSVQVVYEELEQEALFIVKDTGIGIAPLDLDGVFERQNQRSGNEAEDMQGGGYGLTIVKSIAARHNGRVWVESNLGKGSSFFMKIPRVQI